MQFIKVSYLGSAWITLVLLEFLSCTAFTWATAKTSYVFSSLNLLFYQSTLIKTEKITDISFKIVNFPNSF